MSKPIETEKEVYTINFFFDGTGRVEIEARDEEEAKEKYFSGEYEEKKWTEWGDNYSIEYIEVK